MQSSTLARGARIKSARMFNATRQTQRLFVYWTRTQTSARTTTLRKLNGAVIIQIGTTNETNGLMLQTQPQRPSYKCACRMCIRFHTQCPTNSISTRRVSRSLFMSRSRSRSCCCRWFSCNVHLLSAATRAGLGSRPYTWKRTETVVGSNLEIGHRARVIIVVCAPLRQPRTTISKSIESAASVLRSSIRCCLSIVCHLCYLRSLVGFDGKVRLSDDETNVVCC